MPTLLTYPVRLDSPEGKELELSQEIVEVPITGKIISVAAKPGDTVQEGDTSVLSKR